MKLRGRNLAIVGALLVSAGAALVALSRKAPAPVTTELRAAQHGSVRPVSAGKKAVDFSLQDLSGKPVSLSDFRGKVVFLNIWATWCAPCREEMPSIEALYDEFHNDDDFVVLAVSQDTKGKQAVLPYVQKNGYHFRILLDPKNEVAESYDVAGIPETFIIDKTGRIAAHHMGAFDWSKPDVKRALRDLLDG